MLERQVELHRLPISLHAQGHGITGVGMGGEQIRELYFPVERIDIIAVLIDFVIANGCDDVPGLKSAFTAEEFGSTLVI